MSHQIDPLIHQKLQAFSRRRRRLIILRGICAALAMLVATMMLVALIDWLFVLPDWARWTLSGLAYAAVVVIEWRSCVRILLHTPDARELARLIEHAEPKLREDLLSAVELGDPKSVADFDSEQFRALVQTDVAQRMEGVEVGRLLPVHLVRRSLIFAGVICTMLVLGFYLTGTQLGTLLMRALLPGANLARVSKFQIAIVSPDPVEKVVPHGETVPLVAEIHGGRTNKAVLETFTESGGREVVQMKPIGPDQFSATIQVARENVRYRVRAGDAITRKYQLDAVARPHVVAFNKSFKFPEYSRLQPKTVREENGDLAALEGSEVELRLETNRPIRSGELRVELGQKQTVVPLEVNSEKQLVAHLPLNASGIYRVFLVGEQTGFENKFSPEYEIRAEPDLVPQVDLELPKQDLLLPANEIVDVQGTASDDLALAKVSQLVRVNEGPWKETVILTDAGARANVERRWDLFEGGGKAGDLLATKLLAVDLKGNRTESRTIQITLTASGFETKRLTLLEKERELFQTIGELRIAAESFEKQSKEARELFERLPNGDPGRRQATVSGTSALEDYERKLSETQTQLATVLRGAAPGHESHDLVLLGRLLAQMNIDTLQRGRDSLETAAATPDSPLAPSQMQKFNEAGGRSVQRARLAESAYRVLLAAEEVDVLAENMRVVAKEQDRLVALAQRSGDDAKKWTQLGSRLRAMTAQSRALEAQLTLAGTHSEHGNRLQDMQKEIEKQRALVDKALAAAGAPGKALVDPTIKLAKASTETTRKLLELKRDLSHKPAEIFKNLLQDVRPTWTQFERLQQDVLATSKEDKLAAEPRLHLLDRRWDAGSALLKAHGDLEETRANADAYFVGDVRAATLALTGIKIASAEAGWEQRLGELDRAFRVLESGHNLAEAGGGLAYLAANERWELDTPRSRTTNPRDWFWLEDRLRTLPDELGKVKPPEPIRVAVEGAQKLLWDAQKLPVWNALGNEMRERFKTDRVPLGQPQEVERLAAVVKQALDLLRQPMADARKVLAQMAPKISELAAQLAKETDQLKKETEAQAEKTAEQKREEAEPKAKEQLAAQQQLNEKVDALKDLIRAEANKQNVLEEAGRELARDADDALAMLKEPPPKAAAALDDALNAAEQPAEREKATHEAAAEQQKLADSLKQIGEHFDNVEKGKAEETRLAMRATEQENGVKEQLDAQAAKAEQLAAMAQQSPQELLKELERALPKNPEMQKELSQIAQDTLGSAQEKLSEAAKAEQQVAANVDKLAQLPAVPDAAAQTPQQLAATAEQAANEAAKAADTAKQTANEAVQAAKRANNPTAADQARQARTKATAAAESARQAAQAAHQMAQANSPEATAQAAQQTAQKSAEAAQGAQQAEAAAKQAQATAEQAAKTPGAQQADAQQSSLQAAQAEQNAEQANQSAQLAQAAAEQALAIAQQPAGSPPAAPQPDGAPPAAPRPNPMLAKAAQQQAPIGQNAELAGEDVSRAGRHEERLQNMAAGEKLQQLGAAIEQTATQQVPAAQQALAQAQMAKDAQPAVNTAKAELTQQLSALAQAAGNETGAEAAQPSPNSADAPMAAASGEKTAGTPPAQSPAASPSGTPPQSLSGQQASAGAPPAGAPDAPSTPPASTPADATAAAGQPPGVPPSPQEQVWMARTLDALDTALNTPGAAEAANASAQPPAGQEGKPPNAPSPNAPPTPGSAAAQAMADAQSLQSAAAQAAANAMKMARSEAASKTPSSNPKSDMQAKSEGGALAQMPAGAYQAPGEAKNLRAGDWGKLPKKVAEELTQGQREAIAGEYRNQVETYYRVIAERAKKP